LDFLWFIHKASVFQPTSIGRWLTIFLSGGTDQYIVNFSLLMIGHFLFPFGDI